MAESSAAATVKREAGSSSPEAEERGGCDKGDVEAFEKGAQSTGAPATAEDKRRVFDPRAPKKYKPWEKDEMLLLRRGVQRHGVGNWEAIRQDPEFKLLQLRTGVQIKDKWRNLVKFRHLTEEEKQAIALRASKLSRRTAGRSSSFTFGPNGASPDAELVQGGQRGGRPVGGMGAGGQYQSFSAYAQAREARMRAEAELHIAQTAYEQASSKVDVHMAATQHSSWSEAAVGAEELFATVNATMRQFTMCKQRAQAARDLESNLMKSLHLEPNQFGASGTQSMPSSPMGGMTGMSPFADYQKIRPNAELLYGRSQSYDPSCFSRLLHEEESCGTGVGTGTGMGSRRTLSSFSDDGVSGNGGSETYNNIGPPSLMIRTSATTRSPRKASSGSVPSSPLGRMQRQTAGRNSPLARSMSLFGSYDNMTPNSPITQLSSQFDVQLGQQLLQNSMTSQPDYILGAGGSHNGVKDSYPDSPLGFESHMQATPDDCNSVYYGADGHTGGQGLTRRASGDTGANTVFSSELAAMPGASAGMQQAAGYSGGHQLEIGLYQDMFSGQGMHGTVKSEMLELSEAAGLDLHLPEFAVTAASSDMTFGNNCSDVLIDCMEEVLGSDVFMASIPNLEDCS